MLKAIQHQNMVFKMRRKRGEWIMARSGNMNRCPDLNSRAKVAAYNVHLNGTVGDAEQ